MGCGNSVQQHEGVETGPEKRSDLPLELTGCPDDGSVSNQDDQFQSFRVNAGNALFQSAFVFPEITALGSTVPGSSTRAMCMNQKKVKMAFDLRSPEGVHNVAMRQLSAGFLGLQRGPPMEEIVCFDTEMMPPFSLNVTVSDLSAPPSPSSLSNHDASGKRKKRAFQQVPEASRLLAEEAVPVTCQPGSRVRCIGGFKKPLTAMSITRDERLLAGVMGAGKPISGQGFTEEAETEQVKRPTYSVDTFKQESFDRAIKLLDLRTLQAVGVFKEREGVMRTKFLKFIWAQDVALVASTAEGLLRVFNVGRMCKDNDILADGFTFPEMLHITCLAVSFCEHFIAVGGLVDAPSSNLMVQVWRVGDTAKSSSFQQYSKFSQHQENVISVAFRRSSEAVASIDFAGRLLLWDVEHGRIITEILLNQPGNLVYAEGYLTCACRSMIHCWREENGEEGLWNLKFRQIWKKTVKGEAEPMDELVEPPTDTSKGSGGKGTLDNVPTSPLGQAPGDRGQMLRYRSIVLIPGNALLVLSTCKEVEHTPCKFFLFFFVFCCAPLHSLYAQLAILNLEDGSIIDELVLRTIPVAVAVGRTLCIVSDAWGNVYAIDLNLVCHGSATEGRALVECHTFPSRRRTVCPAIRDPCKGELA